MVNLNITAKKRSLTKLPFLLSLLSRKRFRDQFFKRSFDLTFSFTILLLFSPIFLLIAILIKCTSQGPVLFIQDRLGKANTTFKCYKFRTMYIDAEERLEEILNTNAALNAEWKTHQKLKRDPRITPVGNFLRKTSLDELPQFWNSLLGELSVVGPRPYMVFQKRALGNKSALILSVKPGITGLWQTSGRSTLSFQKRIELDADYVKKRSFLYDLKLIIKTIPTLLYNKNAC